MTESRRRLHDRINGAGGRATTSAILSRGFLMVLLVLASCSVILPQAEADIPWVYTILLVDTTATSAILTGNVNPNGLATQWDFTNIPESVSYCPSPPGNLPADNSLHVVTCTATGLTPSTFYQFKLRATNAHGTNVGSVASFTTAGAMALTDWALSNPTLSPASPNVGDAVTFHVVLRAMSTNQPYPQAFTITGQLDGVTITGGSLNYAGPTGSAVTVYSTPTWSATSGTHTIRWIVASGSDTNPSNNEVSKAFTVGPPPAAFDFQIIVSPPTQTVPPGDSASCSISVNLLSGTTKNVALSFSGQPPGVTGTFNPSSGNPTFSSSLSLSVSSSTSSGTYSITVTGTGGGKTHTATFTLIVGQAKDFRLDVSPPSLIVSQGETASYSITVVGLNGFNSQVSLSATGLPASVSHVFSIPSGTPDFTSALTVSLPSNVQTGSFTITVKGSGGGLERYANIMLVINPGVTQTATPTATATQTPTATATQTPDILDILQQNSLLLLGGLLALIVIGTLFALSRRTKHPPPPPPGDLCPTCGKPLTFVKEYAKWYCHNCKEYK